MLKPEKMSKFTVIGPKTVMEDVINRLYSLKVYHIVDHKKSDELDIGYPLEKSGEISSLLIKARALCSGIGIDLSKAKLKAGKNADSQQGSISEKELNEMKKKIERLDESINKSKERLKIIGDESQQLVAKLSLLEKLKLLMIDADSFHDYEYISYVVGTIEKIKNISKFREELNRKTTRYELYTADFEGKTLIAVFFDSKEKQDILDALGRKGFSEMDFNLIKGMGGETAKQIRKMKAELAELNNEKKSLDKEIDVLKKEELDFLASAERRLSMEAEKNEAPLRFASTEKAFVITGWVPSRKTSQTIAEISKAAGEKVYIRSEPAKNEDDVPVKLKNPILVQPFEFFMEMYTLPKYKEIDPTFLMFLTFPLFYGFMLGDIGYGLVTLALFLILRTRLEGDLRRLANAMIFGSVSSIFFGILFGEFFGFEKIGGYEILHVLSRYHQVNELLYIAIAIGVVHINIGLLIGFYNELMAHGFKAAFFEKISWIVLQASVALIALTYKGYLPLQKWVGFAILAAAIGMVYLGEGAKGLIELPSIFSQTLSYARLMAVGLASVILAVVINDLATGMFHSGIIGIIGGGILLVVGHVINIALGLISPFLHSLRLHYVEFFTKFYHGGGSSYAPFGTHDDP